MSILDKFSLRNRVAIVTGGNRGIGRAIAKAFAEAGAMVAIASRDRNKAAETLAELTAAGAAAISVQADVSQRPDIEMLVETVADKLGPIDILVNNAGIGFHADALTLSDEAWHRLFSINLEGVWKTSQIVGAHMAKRAQALS